MANICKGDMADARKPVDLSSDPDFEVPLRTGLLEGIIVGLEKFWRGELRSPNAE
jgi:hypothetical protein